MRDTRKDIGYFEIYLQENKSLIGNGVAMLKQAEVVPDLS